MAGKQDNQALHECILRPEGAILRISDSLDLVE